MKKQRRFYARKRSDADKVDYLHYETEAARDLEVFLEDGLAEDDIAEGFAMHLLKMVSNRKSAYFRDLADAIDAYKEMSLEGTRIIIPSNSSDPAATLLAKAYDFVTKKDYRTVIEEARKMDHAKELPASDATLRNILREIGCDMVDARKK